MPQILIKRDTVPMTVNDIAIGEIGIDYSSGRMYIRKGSGITSDTIIDLGDPVQRLGYTPVSVDGDTMLGTLKLMAGNSTNAPIMFQQGNLLSQPAAHALEWDGANLYITNNGSQRKTIAFIGDNSSGLSSGWSPGRTFTWTGDVNGNMFIDGTVDVTANLTLIDRISNAGLHGDGKNIPAITVNSKGLITNITTNPVTLDTDDVTEANNLYFTVGRSRGAISVSGDLQYNQASGVISYTAPVFPPAALSGDYDDLTNKPVVNVSEVVSGTARTVFMFDNTAFRAIKVVYAISDDINNNYQSAEMLVMNVSASESINNEYSVLNYGVATMGEFSTSVVGTNTVLIFTPNDAFVKNIRMTVTYVKR